MSNSNLVDVTVPAHEGNYTKGRNKKIRCITIHHMAGVLSAEQCGKIFQAKGRNGSSHYGIGNDGKIGLYVDEENTAWTNSNFASNSESVTIETSNSAMGGFWPVGEAAYNSLIRLVADIAKRNDLGRLVLGDNLTWHRMFVATSCPGDFLLSKMNEIAARANEINFPPKPAEEGEVVPKMTNEQVAHEIMYGNNKWGNMPERKENLEKDGYEWEPIQKIINDTLLPNQDKRKEPMLDGDYTGKEVVPVKLVDVKGTPLVQYDDKYTVTEDDGKTVVLTARGAVWARLAKENVRLA